MGCHQDKSCCVSTSVGVVLSAVKIYIYSTYFAIRKAWVTKDKHKYNLIRMIKIYEMKKYLYNIYFDFRSDTRFTKCMLKHGKIYNDDIPYTTWVVEHLCALDAANGCWGSHVCTPCIPPWCLWIPLSCPCICFRYQYLFGYQAFCLSQSKIPLVCSTKLAF